MSCEDVRENLTALSDGELAPEVAGRVRNHLTGCGGCAGELASIERTRGYVKAALGGYPAEATDRLAGAFGELLARLDGPAVEVEAGASLLAAESRHALGQRPARVARASELRRLPSAQRGRPADRSATLPRGRSPRRPWALVGGLALVATALVFAVDRAALLGRFSGGDPSARPAIAKGVGAPAAADRAPRRTQVAKSEAAPAAKGRSSPPTSARLASKDASSESGSATAVADRGDAGRDLSVPDEVRLHPGMFLDLGMVQRLDKLRHLEAVYRQPGAGEGEGGSG